MRGRERCAVVVLAAGRSRRFRGGNKLLAGFRGRPLILSAVDAALRSRGAPVIVVTGHACASLHRVLRSRQRGRLRLVHNRHHRSGMASSLRRGLAAVPDGCAGAVILPGDMPAVRARDIDSLIAALRPGDEAVVPVAGGRRANPVLVARALFPAMQRLAGDRGGRGLLADRAAVREIAGRGATLIDVDTRAQCRRLAARGGCHDGDHSS